MPAGQPGGPPFLDPSTHTYPGAEFLPDVDLTKKPMTTPVGGLFLFSQAGALYAMERERNDLFARRFPAAGDATGARRVRADTLCGRRDRLHDIG